MERRCYLLHPSFYIVITLNKTPLKSFVTLTFKKKKKLFALMIALQNDEKCFFYLKISKFLSWLFEYVEKTA